MFVAYGSKVTWDEAKNRYVVTNKWQFRGPGRVAPTDNNVVNPLHDLGLVSEIDKTQRVE